jgi:predicted ATP-grasp superfamily ATP-dependent carboligase
MLESQTARTIASDLTDRSSIGSSPAVGALVLGGDPGALGVVRSLGRQHIPTWTIVGDYRLAALSRYSVRSFQWPHPDNPRKVQFLLELGERHGLDDGWLLIPSDDEHAVMLARNRELLARRFRVTTPNWAILRWAYDKRLTYQRAAELGLSYPCTYYPVNREEVESMQCDFPVILKPAFKQFINQFTRARAWLAKDRDELLTRYDEAVRLVDSSVVMIQDLIAGGGENQFSYAGLHADGRAIASLVARRTRQYPVDFGQGSSFVETVESDEVESAARLFLEAIRYSGLAEVEFKYDSRDSKYKLLDVNARIWSWHTLGGHAGVDFPYLLWQLVNNRLPAQVRGRVGVSWIRILRDLPAGAIEVWNRRLSLGAYLRSLAGVSEFAVFAADDPLPSMFEIPLLVALKFRTLLSRVRAQ